MSLWIIIPIIGLIAIIVTLIVPEFLNAPEGYEDEDGFHFLNNGVCNGCNSLGRNRDHCTCSDQLGVDNNSGEAEGEVRQNREDVK